MQFLQGSTLKTKKGKTMLIVKSVQIEHCKDNPHGAIYSKMVPPTLFNNDGRFSMSGPEEELVRPLHFVNKDHEHVLVGWTKEVQEALGLPFDHFAYERERAERMRREWEVERKASYGYYEMVRRYETATFWQRLKYLFTRRI